MIAQHSTAKHPGAFAGAYMILGLAGRAGAGKDTCADVLCQAYQFYRLAFADAVRAEIVAAFGIDPALFRVSTKEHKTDALAIGRCNDGDFIRLMVKLGNAIAAPRSPREIMRWWATEYRRTQNPVYWVDRAAETITSAVNRGYRRIVITDVRFLNEADLVRYFNGVVWLVSRSHANQVPADHQSEQELALIHPDAVIDNDGSMIHLATTVMQTYEQIAAGTYTYGAAKPY